MSIIETSIRNGIDRARYIIENTGFIKSQTHCNDDRDLKLLYDIQPACGVKFRDKHVEFGDSYMSCIHVYAAPPKLVRNWMFKLFNKSNVIATIDIETKNDDEVKDNINRAINEHESRMVDARNRSEERDARNTYYRLDALLEEVSSLGNCLKALHVRLFVYAHTFAELEDNVMFIEQQIKEDGFARFGVNVNEQGFEYRSMFLPISVQNKTLSNRKGIPSPANTTAFGLPFHYVGWKDPWGFYFGDTPDYAGNGPVFFYPYLIDRYRTSYDGICFGKKGTGKSTTLKMLIEQNLAMNNRVRIIDVTSEFNGITRKYGGVVIKMDGSEGRLNPLEILRMDIDDTQNYLSHISKLGLMYKLKTPDCKQEEVDLFKDLLKKLYIKKGILRSDEKGNIIYEGITGLAPEAYPIFSDAQKLINEELANYEREAKIKETAKLMIEVLLRVQITINDIVNYGPIFNGHTTITNLMDAEIIDFDIKSVSDMEPTIFDMQLFNVMTIAYDSCMTIGIDMKEKIDNAEIDIEDVIHHTIYIDECHKTINSRKPFAVERMLDILRQDRKYFIGVWLATQNIADMFPDGANSATTDLKTLFSLLQYKLIFKQDQKAVDLIEQVFGEYITPNQRAQIPFFGKRDCLLNFDMITIQMTVKMLSEEKLKYYGGGA